MTWLRPLSILLGVIVLALASVLIFVPSNKSAKSSEKDAAVKKAQQLYTTSFKDKDLTNGPCISEEIIPDWVVDIAHNPREEIDNNQENQCQSYREGKTHHFVELDPQGNLIKAL